MADLSPSPPLQTGSTGAGGSSTFAAAAATTVASEMTEPLPSPLTPHAVSKHAAATATGTAALAADTGTVALAVATTGTGAFTAVTDTASADTTAAAVADSVAAAGAGGGAVAAGTSSEIHAGVPATGATGAAGEEAADAVSDTTFKMADLLSSPQIGSKGAGVCATSAATTSTTGASEKAALLPSPSPSQDAVSYTHLTLPTIYSV